MSKRYFRTPEHRYDSDDVDYRQQHQHLNERRRLKHLRRAMKTRNITELIDIQDEAEHG